MAARPSCPLVRPCIGDKNTQRIWPWPHSTALEMASIRLRAPSFCRTIWT